MRSGVIYTGSLTLQRAITALLLPICVTTLGPAAYGEVALMLAINGVAFAIAGFGLEAAIIRTFFKLADKPEERRAFLSSIGTFLLLAPTGVAVLSLSLFLFWQPVPFGLFALTVFAAGLQVSSTVFSFAVLRSEDNPVQYALINIQYSAVMALLLAVAILWLNLGPAGWLLANLLAWLSVFPYSLRLLGRYSVGLPQMRLLWPALALGLPLVPHMLAHWGLALSDRIVLASLVSDDQLGIYSLGYQAAAFLGLLLTAVNWTVMSRYARHQDAVRGSLAALRPTIVKQAAVTLALSLTWALSVPALLRFVMPMSFHASSGVVPWVTLGYCFLGLYYIPANFLTLTLGQTHLLWIGTLIAALVNVGFNLAVVPRLGIQGAAMGTAVAYGVLLALTCALAVRSLNAHHTTRLDTIEFASAA